jgi:glycogen debranching enzyme
MLTSDAAFSGWGLRTVFSTEARYNPMSYHNGSVWPHDNAVIADGLARYGQRSDVLRIFDGLFDATRNTPLHRLPELFCGFPRRPGAGPTRYPVAASPQAWASAAVFMLLRSCLGMSVDATEARVTFDHPMLPASLQWMRIRGLPVGTERVDIDLHRSGESVSVAMVGGSPAVEVRTL